MTIRRFLLVILAFAIAGNAAAVELKKMTFDELAAASDVVVLGKVIAVNPRDAERSPVAFARIRAGRVLKGSLESPEFRFAYRTGLDEANPDCCRARKQYLFFLFRNPDGSYQSTNGVYGVIRLP